MAAEQCFRCVMAEIMFERVNTPVLGAIAAGMMCAAYAGMDVLIVDHAKTASEKIPISGD